MVPLTILVIMGLFEAQQKDVFLSLAASLCFCRLQFRGTSEDYGIQVSDDLNLKHCV